MSCHICNYWTPEAGCRHYFPDSETVLKLAGYEIKELAGKKIRFKVWKGEEIHRFESLARAATVLIHYKGITFGSPGLPSEPTEEEYKKIMELMKETKDEQAFSYSGIVFLGNRVEAIKKYVKDNPSDKFLIWLDKNYTQAS